MLADTAKLAVNLSLTGNFSSGIATAERELAGLNATAATSSSRVVGAFGSVKGAAITAGGALSHAGGQIKNLLTGPLGFIGLSTGLLSVGGAIKEGLGKANEFSLAIEKLQGLTNDSADSLSQLIAVTDNYGISADRLTKVVGFTEKALGNIAVQQGGAAKFAKDYGFAITDAAGKVLPFNDILLKAADFYNSNADQSTKAAVTAKLFGRSYADLVPVLKLGSQGIKDAEQSAKDLGITLTDTNVKDLAKYRETTRTLGDAMTGLQLQIGLGLVPAFTDLAKSLTGFIANHRTDIVAFFRNAVDAGRKIAGVVGDVASGLVHAWDMIPAPLRDFLVKGLIADRTVKFLFGFDPVATIGKSLLGGLGSSFLSRGSPANPMYVVGLGGTGTPGTPAGGLGKIGAFLGYVGIASIAVGVGQAIADAIGATPQNPVDSASRSFYRNQQPKPAVSNAVAEGKAGGLSLETRDAIYTMVKAIKPDPQGDTRERNRIAKVVGDKGSIATQADQRETNRIARQTGQTTASKIDYAKVETVRATDAATAAINRSRDAIVRAVLSLGTIPVQVTANSVSQKQATVSAHQNPTTMNRVGHQAS